MKSGCMVLGLFLRLLNDKSKRKRVIVFTSVKLRVISVSLCVTIYYTEIHRGNTEIH